MSTAQQLARLSPINNDSSLRRTVAPEARAPGNAGPLMRFSGNQEQTGTLANSKASAEISEVKEVDSSDAPTDLHLRGKREVRNGQPNPLLLLPSQPIFSKNSLSQPINLISVDPESISPMVQNQFRNLGGRVKDIKENMPPDIRRQVSNFIRDKIKEAANLDVDPDRTYVNNFSGAEAFEDGSDGVTGWQHTHQEMTGSKLLTDFVLENFNESTLNNLERLARQSFEAEMVL